MRFGGFDGITGGSFSANESGTFAECWYGVSDWRSLFRLGNKRSRMW